VQLRLGEPDAALSLFKKLHGLLPDSPEVLQQLAACCEAAEDLEGAVQWLEVAASVVPSDAGVMVRLGALHAR
jgi:intraflagellar transport protein 88